MSVMETTYVSITNHTNQPTTPTPPDDYLSIRITASHDVWADILSAGRMPVRNWNAFFLDLFAKHPPILSHFSQCVCHVTFRMFLVKKAKGDTLSAATFFSGISGNKMIDTINTERFTVIKSKTFKVRNVGSRYYRWFFPSWKTVWKKGSFLFNCCCLLLQYLRQSCARGGRRIVENMCYEIRRAEACVD